MDSKQEVKKHSHVAVFNMLGPPLSLYFNLLDKLDSTAAGL